VVDTGSTSLVARAEFLSAGNSKDAVGFVSALSIDGHTMHSRSLSCAAGVISRDRRLSGDPIPFRRINPSEECLDGKTGILDLVFSIVVVLTGLEPDDGKRP
jgi:hypothetical protein